MINNAAAELKDDGPASILSTKLLSQVMEMEVHPEKVALSFLKGEAKREF